ncbi:MAG: hypothetical protein ACXV39_09935 [Halobacteriota archaeon]
MRHVFDFACLIFENNDPAFFEAAIDTLPVARQYRQCFAASYLEFSDAIEMSFISVRLPLTIS